MSPTPLIPDELAAFLESGLPITMATRDAELQPDGAWVWAAQVHGDRRRLTVYLHPDAAAAMRRNLEQHPGIALVFDRPLDHRACQVKGRLLAARDARPAERTVVEAQIEGVRRALEAINLPRAATVGWTPWPCAAFELEVTDLFEQTPGPGTGGRLP